MARKKAKYNQVKIRAMRSGAQHAIENIQKHGCPFAKSGLRKLEPHTRTQDAGGWFRVYVRAYRLAYEARCHRGDPSRQRERGAAFQQYVRSMRKKG